MVKSVLERNKLGKGGFMLTISKVIAGSPVPAAIRQPVDPGYRVCLGTAPETPVLRFSGGASRAGGFLAALTSQGLAYRTQVLRDVVAITVTLLTLFMQWRAQRNQKKDDCGHYRYPRHVHRSGMPDSMVPFLWRRGASAFNLPMRGKTAFQ